MNVEGEARQLAPSVGGEERLAVPDAGFNGIQADVDQPEPSGTARPVPVEKPPLRITESDRQRRFNRRAGIGNAGVAVDAAGQIHRDNRLPGTVRDFDIVAELRPQFTGEAGSEQPVHNQVARPEIGVVQLRSFLHMHMVRQVARRLPRLAAQLRQRPGRIDRHRHVQQCGDHQRVAAVVAAPGQHHRPPEPVSGELPDQLRRPLPGPAHQPVAGGPGGDRLRLKAAHRLHIDDSHSFSSLCDPLKLNRLAGRLPLLQLLPDLLRIHEYLRLRHRFRRFRELLFTPLFPIDRRGG